MKRTQERKPAAPAWPDKPALPAAPALPATPALAAAPALAATAALPGAREISPGALAGLAENGTIESVLAEERREG